MTCCFMPQNPLCKNYGGMAYSHTALHIWNDLTVHMRTSNSLAMFITGIMI